MGELEFSKELSKVLNVPLARGVQIKGTQDSPDVTGLEPYGLHPEVKRTESTLALATYSALEQANSDCGDFTPFVASRRNRREWIICVELENLIPFCEKILKARDNGSTPTP